MLIKAEHPCCVEIKCTNTAVKAPRSMKFPRYTGLEDTGKDLGRPTPRPVAPLARSDGLDVVI